MYFKLYHDTGKKTLALPRAVLQLSGLSEAEELTLHTGGGYVLAARDDLTTRECVLLVKFLTATAASLLTQLAEASHAAGGLSGRDGNKDDLFDQLDDGFLSMLLDAGVDLDSLREIMHREEKAHG